MGGGGNYYHQGNGLYLPNGHGMGYPGYLNHQRPYGGGGHHRPSYYQHQHQYNHNPFASWFSGRDYSTGLNKPRVHVNLVPNFGGVLGTRTGSNLTETETTDDHYDE